MGSAIRTRFLSGACWVIGFALAGFGLIWLGRYQFLRIGWSDPLGWLSSADPETALAALARAVGLALVAWVGASTIVYVAARFLGADPSSIDWLSIGPIRKLVDAVVAGSLVATTMAPMAAVAAVPPSTQTVATDPSAVAPGYVPIPAGLSQPAAPLEPSSRQEPPPGSVIVVPGDNLWKLAEQRMEAVLGRRATDAEVAPYWVEMIEANRNRLRSGDPDLIYPGEELVLPSIANPES